MTAWKPVVCCLFKTQKITSVSTRKLTVRPHDSWADGFSLFSVQYVSLFWTMHFLQCEIQRSALQNACKLIPPSSPCPLKFLVPAAYRVSAHYLGEGLWAALISWIVKPYLLTILPGLVPFFFQVPEHNWALAAVSLGLGGRECFWFALFWRAKILFNAVLQ